MMTSCNVKRKSPSLNGGHLGPAILDCHDIRKTQKMEIVSQSYNRFHKVFRKDESLSRHYLSIYGCHKLATRGGYYDSVESIRQCAKHTKKKNTTTTLLLKEIPCINKGFTLPYLTSYTDQIP